MSIRANVDARRLDQRVRFDRSVTTQDATGDPVQTWPTLGTCWAAVDGAKASGAESYDQDGIRSVASYTIWIRADVFQRLDLRVMDRVVWQRPNGERIFDISDIPDQQLRGRLIAIICSSGRNDG